MICHNCGFENEEQAKFCKKCGTQLIKENNESVSKTEENDNSRKNIILATVFICLIIFIFAIALSNNSISDSSISISGPSLIVDELSEYHESDTLNVHFYDENNNPMSNEPITLKLQGVSGGRTIITNSTDNNGDVSFRLDMSSGDYVLSICPVNYNQEFKKDIFIEKSGYPWYNETFIIDNKNYVVRDKDIYMDMDSYNYATLQGYDDEGNLYIWFAGEWFRSEDISNGNVILPV